MELKSSDEQHLENNIQDYFNSSLLFAEALNIILEEKEGVVVDVKEHIKLPDDAKKIIVFKYKEQIHIYKCDGDLPHGTSVNMDEPETK